MAYNKSDWSRKNRKENDKHHRNDWRKELDDMEERTCSICGKQYIYPKDDGSDLNCCSDQCELDRFTTGTCRECGCEFPIDAANKTETDYQSFCCQTCADKYWGKHQEECEF